MENHQKQYIRQNLLELVENTKCNTTFLTVLIQNGVLGSADRSHLDSIQNEMTRADECYRLLTTKKDSFPHLISALKESCQTGALEILKRISEASPSVTDIDNSGNSTVENSIRFDVQPPYRLFTGRANELLYIYDKLQKSSTSNLPQTVAIIGLGGIGKTELARRYIQQYSKKYDNVIWISAQTEETMTESFRRLASDRLELSTLNVDRKDKAVTSIADDVYNYFKGQQNLFVFDNAESTDYIRKFMPFRVSNPPYILITSRDRDWSFSLEVLLLVELAIEEAVTLVKNGLNIPDNAQGELVRKLVKRVQCFPLALSQAISFIQQQWVVDDTYTISQYLEVYESCSERILASELAVAELNTYTQTTLTTWKITAEKISSMKDIGSKAMHMLNMISFFQPDKIPTKLLLSKDNAEQVQSEALFSRVSHITRFHSMIKRIFKKVDNSSTPVPCDQERALRLLVKYSMVNIQAREQTISIHRLVQEVTRIQLKKKKVEQPVLQTAMTLLSENIELNNITHLCSVFKHCGVHRSLILEFKQVPWQILKEFFSSERFHLASRIGNEMKEILLIHLPPDDPDVVRSEGWFAYIDFKLGNFENCLKTLERVVPIGKENKRGVFSQAEVIHAEKGLAITYQELGKLTECLKILVEMFEKLKVLHGLNNWQTIEALADISRCLEMLGYFKTSTPTNPEYLNILKERTVEVSLMEPLGIVTTFKSVYESNKHLIGIERNNTEVMVSVSQCLNVIAPETAFLIANEVYERGKNSDEKGIIILAMRALDNLAVLEANKGKNDEALSVFQNVHTQYSVLLGSNHIETLVTKSNVCTMLRRNGRNEAALEGFQDLLKTLLRYYPNHPEVFDAEESIQVCLFQMERYDESLESFVKLREKIEKRFGQDSPRLSGINSWIKKIRSRTASEKNKETATAYKLLCLGFFLSDGFKFVCILFIRIDSGSYC